MALEVCQTEVTIIWTFSCKHFSLCSNHGVKVNPLFLPNYTVERNGVEIISWRRVVVNDFLWERCCCHVNLCPVFGEVDFFSPLFRENNPPVKQNKAESVDRWISLSSSRWQTSASAVKHAFNQGLGHQVWKDLYSPFIYLFIFLKEVQINLFTFSILNEQRYISRGTLSFSTKLKCVRLGQKCLNS